MHWLEPEEADKNQSSAQASSYGTLDPETPSGESAPGVTDFIHDDRDAAKDPSEIAPLLAPTEERQELSGVRSTLYLLSFPRMTVAFIGTASSMSVCTAFETVSPLYHVSTHMRTQVLTAQL